jgi:hypothetical protein
VTCDAPVTEVVPIRRTHAGRPVAADLCLSYWRGELAIDTDWNGRTWKARRTYTVRRIPTDWAGRGYRVARQGAEEPYDVFIADAGPPADTCDCRGFARFGYCVHSDAMRYLASHGHA